jgi:hypothetical protein
VERLLFRAQAKDKGSIFSGRSVRAADAVARQEQTKPS